jgi:hypothetical protein
MEVYANNNNVQINIERDNQDNRINQININIRLNNQEINEPIIQPINNQYRILNENELLENIKFSKIISSKINNNEYNINTFYGLIIIICILINDKLFILNNTKINIIDGDYNQKGFKYNNDLRYSIRYMCAESSCKEIIKMCRLKNYRLELLIKLKTNEIVKFIL